MNKQLRKWLLATAVAVLACDVLATEVQLYGATFENTASDTSGSLNDFAYQLGDYIITNNYYANNNFYNSVIDGERYGWLCPMYVSYFDDNDEYVYYYDYDRDDECEESRIIPRTDAAVGQALQLNTDALNLIHRFKPETATAIETAVADGDVAYYEVDVKFIGSDTRDSGIRGGTDDAMLAIYAYYDEYEWGWPCPTNLVVYHACLGQGDPWEPYNDGIGYTNEVFAVSIDPEAYTKIRVEMRQIDIGGTMYHRFSVSVNGTILTSASAYQEGCWFLTTEAIASATERKTFHGKSADNIFRGRDVVNVMRTRQATRIVLRGFHSMNFKGEGEIDNVNIGVVKQTDPIPAIGENATVVAVTNAVVSAGFADEAAVMAAIGGSATNYIAFKAWAQDVAGGEAAVVASDYAAVSWLLGAEGLFENDPEITFAGLEITDPARSESSPHLQVTVVVKDGEEIALVDQAKVAGMFEATGDLGDWDGEAKLTPSVSDATRNLDGTMTFTVVPGDGTATSAFLRIRATLP